MDFAKDITDLLAHGGWQAVTLGIAFLVYKIGTTGIITMGVYKAIVKLADAFGKGAVEGVKKSSHEGENLTGVP